jgi:hypothetical protein
MTVKACVPVGHRRISPHSRGFRSFRSHVQYSSLLAPEWRLDLFSVPMWPFILSNRLKIIDLVSFYLPNNLILDRLIL